MILKEEFITVIFSIDTTVYKSQRFVGRIGILEQLIILHSQKVKISRQDTQAYLQACSRKLTYEFPAQSSGLVTGITWDTHSTWRSLRQGGKWKGAQLSLQHPWLLWHLKIYLWSSGYTSIYFYICLVKAKILA